MPSVSKSDRFLQLVYDKELFIEIMLLTKKTVAVRLKDGSLQALQSYICKYNGVENRVVFPASVASTLEIKRHISTVVYLYAYSKSVGLGLSSDQYEKTLVYDYFENKIDFDEAKEKAGYTDLNGIFDLLSAKHQLEHLVKYRSGSDDWKSSKVLSYNDVIKILESSIKPE